MPDTGYILVDDQEKWNRLSARLRAVDRLAIDVEADGFHRYPERIALIQIALPDGEILLLDNLAVDDLSALGEALADTRIKTVVHSAAYDVRVLHRDYGFAIDSLMDTALAAQFLGEDRTGLANVVAEYLGLSLQHKSKEMQRQDWSERPLSRKALAYAAEDVAWLLRLEDRLSERVAGLGRADWLAEECLRLSQARYDAEKDPEMAFMEVKGARELSSRGRAILRELFALREIEARALGRPPHRILHNQTMLALAASPETPLNQLRGVGHRLRRDGAAALRAALERGMAAAPVDWPRVRGSNPWTPDARARLGMLKGWRQAEAQALGLAAGLIWPARHLERMAIQPDSDPRSLDRDDPPQVRAWQWAALGPSLARLRRKQAWVEPPPA
jgi:ribonuclease D